MNMTKNSIFKGVLVIALVGLLSSSFVPSASAQELFLSKVFNWLKASTASLLGQTEPVPGPTESTNVTPPPMTPKPIEPGQTGPMQPAPTQPSQPGTMMKPMMEGGEEGPSEEFVDPREINNALRDIKRMLSEIKKFIKQLKKIQNSADDIAKLNELTSELQTATNNIKNPPADYSQREVLQDFYDQNYWETINTYRAKIELPKELARITKDLKKLEGLLKIKTYQKLGLDMNLLQNQINEIKEAVKSAQDNYQAGNLEDAMDALEPIREGMQPGEITCVLYGLKDSTRELSRIKDKEIKAQIQEILQPIIDAANEGDFREACQSLNDIRNEIMKVMSYASKSKGLSPEMKQKIEKLQKTVEQKFGGEEPADQGE